MQPTCRQALKNGSDTSSFLNLPVVTKELRREVRRIASLRAKPYLQGVVSNLKKEIVLFRLERGAYWHSRNTEEYLVKFTAAVKRLCDTALQRRQQLLAFHLVKVLEKLNDPGCARARPINRK